MPSNLYSEIHSAIHLVNGHLMGGSVILNRLVKGSAGVEKTARENSQSEEEN